MHRQVRRAWNSGSLPFTTLSTGDEAGSQSPGRSSRHMIPDRVKAAWHVVAEPALQRSLALHCTGRLRRWWMR